MSKFLKPRGKQFEVVDLDYKGHQVITGSAGVGKSICAILRARALANRFNEKIIILSYNNTLVNYLRNNIGKEENIEVTTFHKVATAYLRGKGKLKINEILSNKDGFIKRAIKVVKAIEKGCSTLDRERFIIEEIAWMEKVGCLTLKEYEEISRYGRGKARLEKANRKYVYKVYETYIKLRSNAGYRYDWDDLSYYANEFLLESNEKREPVHIIIDEAQDFSPTMIRFLVNYVGNTGTLMYLGDSGQQIYGSNGTWKSSGLSVRKVYKLDQNYRNTIEIERLSNELRKEMKLDEQEVSFSQNSVISGEIPSVYKINKIGYELNFMLSKIDELSKNKSLGIITINNEEKDLVCNHLAMNRKNHLAINRDEKSFKGENGIYVGTYHSIKGLEFDNVILFKCSNSDFDLDKNLAKEDIETLEYKALKLLYVGITRAKEKLTIIYSGELASVFPKNKVLSDGKKLYENFVLNY